MTIPLVERPEPHTPAPRTQTGIPTIEQVTAWFAFYEEAAPTSVERALYASGHALVDGIAGTRAARIAEFTEEDAA